MASTIGASARIAQLRAEAGLAQASPDSNATSLPVDEASATAAAVGTPEQSSEIIKAAKVLAGAPGTAEPKPEAEQGEPAEVQPGCARKMLMGITAVAQGTVDFFSSGAPILLLLILTPFWFLGRHILRAYGLLPPAPENGVNFFGVVMQELFSFAEERPAIYLGLNFLIAFCIGAFFLFLKDMTDWWTARQAAARQAAQGSAETAYQPLMDEEAGEEGDGGAGTAQNPEELAKELRRVTDQAEELEIKVRVHKKAKATSDFAAAARDKLKTLQARRDELFSILHGSSKPADEDEKSVGADAPAQSMSQMMVSLVLSSSYTQILTRSGNGLLVVTLYFADIWSDIQVLDLLLSSGNHLWAVISISILVVQFGVVQMRVIPYMRSTFGRDSAIYLFFLIFGFPFGLLGLVNCWTRTPEPAVWALFAR